MGLNCTGRPDGVLGLVLAQAAKAVPSIHAVGDPVVELTVTLEQRTLGNHESEFSSGAAAEQRRRSVMVAVRVSSCACRDHDDHMIGQPLARNTSTSNAMLPMMGSA